MSAVVQTLIMKCDDEVDVLLMLLGQLIWGYVHIFNRRCSGEEKDSDEHGREKSVNSISSRSALCIGTGYVCASSETMAKPTKETPTISVGK